ncbi:MAG: RidA family protein [Phycisphaerales bacterium]|nr:RidA family protein [Phycisphaerales bacterium]
MTNPPSPAPTHSAAGTPEYRLAALGLTLPEPPKPVAAYIACRRAGNLLYISGQVPMLSGKMLATGAIPDPVSIEQGRACARQCVLNALAVIRAEAGTLAAVRQVVRVGVFVCSQPGFTQQPQVANGASELLVEVFGDAGRHARAAVGSVALPLGAPVEVEMIVEV